MKETSALSLFLIVFLQTTLFSQEVGQVRAVPVKPGEGENGLLFAYSADKDIDPWVSMFYAPSDKLKLAVYNLEGKEIGKKVIPASLDDSSCLFIGNKRKYKGHSEVIQPTLLRDENRWNIFTCRETGAKGEIKPRLVMFDEQGKQLWTDLDERHMDMGWTAHLNTDSLQVLAFTISRGDKKAGPQGFCRFDVKEFTCNGRPESGFHFLSMHAIQHLGNDACLAMASKFMELPGELLLCNYILH